MDDYTGKVCPFCKTPFRPGDDIVICSNCDMPHHKDCWVENQGCTTFGCQGTIKAPDRAASSVTGTQMAYEAPAHPTPSSIGDFVFCTGCGTRNPKAHSFCGHCGSRLVTAVRNTPPAPTGPDGGYIRPTPAYPPRYSLQSDGYDPTQAVVDQDMHRLVGTKTEYYIPKFHMMKARNTAVSWNWPAFLVSPYWMIYRKMYGYGAAVLAVDLLVSLVNSPILSLLALCGYIVFGILGNNIYMKHLEGKADQVRTMGEPYKSQFISSNGGVNATAAALTVAGRIILISILLA